MTRARFGAVCLLAGVAWSVFVIVVAGARYPGYSHVSDFISALGAHGARDGFAVSWAGFFVMGTLLAVGSVLVWPTFNGVALAACGIVLAGMSTFVGYAGSALWRCDFGCPEAVHSSTQSLHFAVSAADLIGLSAGVALVAWSLRRKPQWRALARASATTAASNCVSPS